MSRTPAQRTTEQGLKTGEGIALYLSGGDDTPATAALMTYAEAEVAFPEKEGGGKFQVTDRDHTGILLYIANAPVNEVTFDCALRLEQTKANKTNRAIT